MFVKGIYSRLSYSDFQTSTPYQKQVPESDSTLHQFCIMVASCPSLRCSYRKEPVSCREAGGFVSECWKAFFYPPGNSHSKMGRTCSKIMAILCSPELLKNGVPHFRVVTFEEKNLHQIEFLATASWKCGFLQSFSCPRSQSVTHCRKEIFHTCLSKESMPFVKSKSPLPTRSLRLPGAAVHSSSPALWLHHSHPCVAAAEKNPSHAKKQRVWSRSCGLQELLQFTDCALSCGMRVLQTNEQLSRLSV